MNVLERGLVPVPTQPVALVEVRGFGLPGAWVDRAAVDAFLARLAARVWFRLEGGRDKLGPASGWLAGAAGDRLYANDYVGSRHPCSVVISYTPEVSGAGSDLGRFRAALDALIGIGKAAGDLVGAGRVEAWVGTRVA